MACCHISETPLTISYVDNLAKKMWVTWWVSHQQSENEVIKNLWTSCWVWVCCFFSLDAMDFVDSITWKRKEEQILSNPLTYCIIVNYLLSLQSCFLISWLVRTPICNQVLKKSFWALVWKLNYLWPSILEQMDEKNVMSIKSLRNFLHS
jgi:hypothetical protein